MVVSDSKAAAQFLRTSYGDRRAMVHDPFGNVFQVAHRVME
jgi:uncharacterized glyoxalase superfamily protein PhnB